MMFQEQRCVVAATGRLNAVMRPRYKKAAFWWEQEQCSEVRNSQVMSGLKNCDYVHSWTVLEDFLRHKCPRVYCNSRAFFFQHVCLFEVLV